MIDFVFLYDIALWFFCKQIPYKMDISHSIEAEKFYLIQSRLLLSP